MVSFHLKNSQLHIQYMWGKHLKLTVCFWGVISSEENKPTYLGSLGMALSFLAQDSVGFVIMALLWEEREAPCSFHVPHFLLL